VACREAGISQQSYYRWRKEYGGLELDQAKRMRSRFSRMSPRETCEPQTAPAGGRRHSGEVWPFGTSGLPDRRPAPRDTAIHHIVRADEDALTRAIVSLASQYGRYGYRRITSLLADAGGQVGCDRVQRIWRREGLKVPRKQSEAGSGSTTDPASA
jgi:hypothetical protein